MVFTKFTLTTCYLVILYVVLIFVCPLEYVWTYISTIIGTLQFCISNISVHVTFVRWNQKFNVYICYYYLAVVDDS